MFRLIVRRVSTIKDQYYTVLELKPGATEQEIKQAYTRLALLYHPGAV